MFDALRKSCGCALKTQWAALDDVRNDQCRWQAEKSLCCKNRENKKLPLLVPSDKNFKNFKFNFIQKFDLKTKFYELNVIFASCNRAKELS
jgi:hypothetical protein